MNPPGSSNMENLSTGSPIETGLKETPSPVISVPESEASVPSQPATELPVESVAPVTPVVSEPASAPVVQAPKTTIDENSIRNAVNGNQDTIEDFANLTEIVYSNKD